MMTLPPPEDIVMFLVASVVLIIGVYNVPFVEIPSDAVVMLTSSFLFGAGVEMPRLPDLY